MRAVWPVIRNWAAERSRRWARRRQGVDAARLRLTSERIYILPTAAGFVYGAMVATMLAGSMNYNNNLAFALTFLLAGMGIVAIYHTHRTLAGLRLDYIGAEPVFAGDSLRVRFSLVNDSSQPREEIYLDWPGTDAIAGGLGASASRVVTLPLATARRGPLPLPALRLSTRAPLGLTRAWAWVHMHESPIVYPQPAHRATSAATAAVDAPTGGLQSRGNDDFAGLRDYQAGDSPRRIAWKSYARSGELLAREFHGALHEELLWIDWEAVAAPDTETRVSRLARLVIDAFEAGRTWGLRGPGVRVEPASGMEQLHRCLRSLATIAPPAGTSSR